ncbi:DUF4198 domain-containing protein [Salmonella enterica]|uniref:DUF4198 domain-containing protein n=1 Tax=Salmonella enterica TaxID=28901 RepID=UPI000DED14FD|nr:DUF4198 domain-containing protein [Salmonella enterica]EAA5440337.1 DUF4198 domain-containing protein [Salmonella enterica subsp. diarizonae]EBR3877631.1 DUF4198 domain-containing protein [Salmonella enterica subsp. arizonae]AXD10453.1 DUF4198 domain-containing protein [Salmonella enterica]EAP4868015.1 DUF4198 domain-containing protein [Salmonella enterica]EBI9918242.1 DUF4198 domain-containing protein [Salmonella enterica]
MKTLPVSATFLLSLMAFSVRAHDVWVTSHSEQREVVAVIGYGHHFPDRGTLPGRKHYFSLPRLTDGKQIITLQPTREAYIYRAENIPIPESYIITASMKPTFWSRTSAGWRAADKKQRPDVTYCEFATKYARTITGTGGPADMAVIAQPTGQELEIIPVTNPLKASEHPAKFRIMYKNVPLENAEVEINSAEYVSQHHHDHRSHRNTAEHHEHASQMILKSDATGIITVNQLPAGEWLLLTKQKSAYSDISRCDETMTAATLSFTRR